jgi:hypothetical protein
MLSNGAHRAIYEALIDAVEEGDEDEISEILDACAENWDPDEVLEVFLEVCADYGDFG